VLSESGIRHSIGVCSGPVFVGTIGSRRRCEHSIVSDTVNSAARLANLRRQGTLIVDDVTATRAGGNSRQVSFRSSGAVRLKGKAKPVNIYQPSGVLRSLRSHGARHDQDIGDTVPWQATNKLVGREPELAFLEEALLSDSAASSPSRTTRMVILEGDRGAGKSLLADEIVSTAATRSFDCVWTEGDATQSDTPLHAWHNVQEHILGCVGELNPSEKRFHVLEYVYEHVAPELRPFASVLNMIAPIGLPETGESRKLSEDPQAAVAKVVELFTHMLLNTCIDNPLLVIIDDAHALDEFSWKVVDALLRVTPKQLELAAWDRDSREATTATPVRLLLCSHSAAAVVDAFNKPMVAQLKTSSYAPLEHTLPSILEMVKNVDLHDFSVREAEKKSVSLPGFDNMALSRIALAPLTRDALVEFAWSRFALPDTDTPPAVDDALVEFLHTTASGNALFTKELLVLLEGDGHAVFQDQRVQLAKPLTDISAPPSLQALAASRLDALPANELLLAKVCACFGSDIPRHSAEVAYFSVLRASQADSQGDEAASPDASTIVQTSAAAKELIALYSSLANKSVLYEGDSSTLHFCHGIFGTVLLDTMLLSQRAMIHRAICEHYDHPGKKRMMHADTLARHYSELVLCVAGSQIPAEQDIEKALSLASDMVARGETQSSPNLAVEWMNKKRAVVDACAAAGLDTPAFKNRRFDVLSEFGLQICALQGPFGPMAKAVFEEALPLLDFVDYSPLKVPMLNAFWSMNCVSCRWQISCPTASLMIRLGEENDDPTATFLGYNSLATCKLLQGMWGPFEELSAVAKRVLKENNKKDPDFSKRLHEITHIHPRAILDALHGYAAYGGNFVRTHRHLAKKSIFSEVIPCCWVLFVCTCLVSCGLLCAFLTSVPSPRLPFVSDTPIAQNTASMRARTGACWPFRSWMSLPHSKRF
jgi:AAA ATPase domain/Adenylate and Guanylate cyclase catalytic domain